jgi:PLP dependent protein
MSTVAEALQEVEQRITEACRMAGRGRDQVKLLAVSKTFPAEAIRAAYDAGQRLFGESRQQEAAGKIEQLPADIEWHFIGTLQRNKVRKILPSFSLVQSVDSLRMAEHMSRVAGEERLYRRILLEVNIGAEASKGGFSVDQLRAEFAVLKDLPSLKVVGLMAIPPDEEESAAARRWFAQLRELRDELAAAHGVPLPELSMGMSGDFEEAILEGSTLVRVGSAIFGNRTYPVP